VRSRRKATMSEVETHIQHLFAAELQFRLASAVRLTTTMTQQPLDLPMEWTHGQHRVWYEEIALRQDQADYAAFLLHRSATYTMAVAIKDAIEAVAPGLPKAVQKAKTGIKQAIKKAIQGVKAKPWTCSDDDVCAAYHIARLPRNTSRFQ
jgi:urease accessory protein UreH